MSLLPSCAVAILRDRQESRKARKVGVNNILITKFSNLTIPLLLHSSGKFDMKKIGPDSPRYFCRICNEAFIRKC